MLRIPLKLKIPSQYEEEPKPSKSPRFWRRAFMGLSFGYLLLALLLSTVVVLDMMGHNTVKCSQFKTRVAAQKALERNPVRYGSLDRDKNGQACQGLPNA